MSSAREETLPSALCPRRDAAATFGGASTVTVDSLLRRAATIAALLPEPSPGSEVAFAFGHDRLAFAAALLGTWARGHRAALPADATRDNVMPVLMRPRNVEFLHDTGVGRGLFVSRVLERAELAPGLLEAPSDPSRPVLSVFRAGTANQSSDWTTAELLAEVGLFAERLAPSEGAAVVSSLTPTAWPSLLFGLLVPLRRGARFQVGTPAGVVETGDAIRAHRAEIAVVARTHARELAELPAGALSPLARLVVAADSLDSPARVALERTHGVRVETLLEPSASGWGAAAMALREELLAVRGVRDVSLRPVPGGAGERLEVLVAAAAPAATTPELERIARRHATAEFGFTLRAFPALPRDANGLVPDALFFLSFARGRDGRGTERELRWEELPRDDPDTRRFRTRIPLRYAFFDGHFPPYPVLAGAVQLHELVLPRLRSAWPGTGTLTRAVGLKFPTRIEPGDELELELERSGEGEFRFEIRRGQSRCSGGRLSFDSRAGGGAE